MNLSRGDIEVLAREIAARLDPAALWDSSDVAAHLKRSQRYVTEHLVHQPGFPTPVRLPAAGGGLGQPLWPRGEVEAYVMEHRGGRRPGRPGRPRNPVD